MDDGRRRTEGARFGQRPTTTNPQLGRALGVEAEKNVRGFWRFPDECSRITAHGKGRPFPY